MKKISKNKKSRQVIMSAIFLTLLLIISISTSVIVPEEIVVSAQEEDNTILSFENQYETQASCIDFTYHKKITFDHTQVSGISNFINFPVCVNISNDGDITGLADEDFAFWNSDNSTQLNHEIELYDSTYGNLTAWVNVTVLSHNADTVIWMYYNDSDGTSEENVAGTWANCIAIYHMTYNGYLTDSLNAKNGTVNSAPITNITGTLGYGIDFDGLDDWFNITDDAFKLKDNTSTISYVKYDDISSYGFIYGMGDYDNHPLYQLFLQEDGNNDKMVAVLQNMPYFSAYGTTNQMTSLPWVLNKWKLFSVTAGWGTDLRLYNDTKLAPTHNIINASYDLGSGSTFWAYIGRSVDGLHHIGGIIEEIRFYNETLSSDYINTTYSSIHNATNGSFFTIGGQGTQDSSISSYVLRGLPNGRITWSGTAGHDVWCNTSGDTYETIEINMSINSSDNVTDLIVNVGDLNDTLQWINASNITLYVSTDNTSYGYMGTFTDGGSNISINTSTWNAVTMGTTPFTHGGITDKNESVYLRFNLTIPADITTDTFWSLSSTTYKIYIGRKI